VESERKEKNNVEIKDILKSMSLEEKIGQVVMCGFYGTTPSAEIEELIKKYHLGNVILFKRNIESPNQLKELTSSLQKMANLPLSIAIDQEGGVVTRLNEPFTTFPGNMATAATYDEENSYLTGLIMAREMRAVGINWDLAPVVDVNDLPENPGIGVRSYSDDPEIVANFATQFINGLHEGKVAACAKHFPGKGHSAKDAHLEMPTVERSVEELENIDLFPFKETIKAGLDAVMPSHVYYPAICEEENLPATLSREVMTTLLRERMNFDGVCITDDLEMGGITNDLHGSDAAWMSLKAGADIVMMCHTFEEQVKTFEKIKEKVMSGELSRKRLDEAVLRVLKLKEKLGLFDGKLIIEDEIGKDEYKAIAEKITECSITICRNMDQIIDHITEGPILILYPSTTKLVKVEEKADSKEIEMEKVLKKSVNFPVKSMFFSLKPSAEEIKKVVKAVEKFDGTVLLNTVNAYLNPDMKKMVTEVMKVKAEKTLLIALRNPYDAFHRKTHNSISLYNDLKISQRVFAKMISLNKKFVGKLPIIHWSD
jgi:beta-N-acetylhexosaminidase